MISLLKINLLVWFRTKENLFWSIVWPVMWFLLVYYVFPPLPGQTEEASLEFFYPAGIFLILLSSSMISLAIKIAGNKEFNVLKKLKILPLSIEKFFLIEVLSAMIFSLISMAVLSVLAYIFGVRVTGNMFDVFLVVALGMLVFTSIAFLIGGISKRMSEANIISMIFMFAMMFLSSAFFDLSESPSFLATVSNVLPGTPFCDSLRGVMFESYTLGDIKGYLAILAAWAIAATFLSFKTFRTY